ncbi:MAG: glycosyltransferase family 39 protein [candidate division WWE3 bacterium]|nr:glycosyltransferase family 39 protein [candidate division WWE3 bacterium]
MLVKLKIWVPVFLLVIIIAGGTTLRIYGLPSIPRFPLGDSAYYAVQALSLITHPRIQFFFPEHTGVEPLFMYLLASFFLILGKSFMTMKILVALINIVGIGLFFLLLREIFGKERHLPIIVGTLLYCVSYWVLYINRLPFRVNLLIPFEVLSILLALRAIRLQRFRDTVLAGLSFGLGFYTYTSFKVNLLPMLALFGGAFISRGNSKNRKETLKHAMIYTLVTFLVALPLIIFLLGNTTDFMFRVNQLSVFSRHAHPYRVLIENTWRYTQLIFVEGFSYNFFNQLIASIGLLAVVSCFLIKLNRGQKNVTTELLILSGFVAFGVIAILIFDFSTYNGYYESLEIGGLAVFKILSQVYLINLIVGRLKNKRALLALGAIILLATACFELYRDIKLLNEIYNDKTAAVKHDSALTVLDLAQKADQVYYFDYGYFDAFDVRVQPIIDFNRQILNLPNNIIYIRKSEWGKSLRHLNCEEKRCLAILPQSEQVLPGVDLKKDSQTIINLLINGYGGKISNLISGPNNYIIWTN